MDLVQDGNCHSVGEILSRKIGQCASLLHNIISKKNVVHFYDLFSFLQNFWDTRENDVPC